MAIWQPYLCAKQNRQKTCRCGEINHRGDFNQGRFHEGKVIIS